MATCSCVRLADAKPFAKFFRMLRIGLPEDAVRQAMRVQGVDERVDDRVYRKILRMLLVGVPPAAVEAAMQRELQSTAYDQTLGKLKAALARRSAGALGPWDAVKKSSIPTPSTGKFAKMERVGVPTGAVEQAQRLADTKATAEAIGDGLDGGLGLDGSQSAWVKLFLLVSPTQGDTKRDALEKPLLGHPVVGTFFKMLRAGVPEDAGKTALARAGLPQELVRWDASLPVSSLAAND